MLAYLIVKRITVLQVSTKAHQRWLWRSLIFRYARTLNWGCVCMSNISLMTGFTRIPHVSTSLILQYKALYTVCHGRKIFTKFKNKTCTFWICTMKENANGKLWYYHAPQSKRNLIMFASCQFSQRDKRYRCMSALDWTIGSPTYFFYFHFLPGHGNNVEGKFYLVVDLSVYWKADGTNCVLVKDWTCRFC